VQSEPGLAFLMVTMSCVQLHKSRTSSHHEQTPAVRQHGRLISFISGTASLVKEHQFLPLLWHQCFYVTIALHTHTPSQVLRYNGEQIMFRSGQACANYTFVAVICI
jgi:hypothetical protein